jgi:hypothetical protein
MAFLLLFIQAVASRYCEGKDKSYKIGDKAVLCVYINPANYSETNDIEVQDMEEVLAVEVEVDQFSGLKLKNSFKTVMSDCNESRRFLQGGNGTNNSNDNSTNEDSNKYENCTSYQGISVAYSKKIYSKFAPYTKEQYVGIVFSIVVSLESGKVKKIQWDNFCDICSDKCVKWKKEEVCAEKFCKGGKEKDCDPRIYVTWIGTDANDENLLSASYRISQFRKYSIYSMYSQTKSKF